MSTAKRRKRDKWELIEEGDTFIARSTITPFYEKWSGEPVTEKSFSIRLGEFGGNLYKDSPTAEAARQAALSKFVVVVRGHVDEDGEFEQAERLCDTLEEARDAARAYAQETLYDHCPWLRPREPKPKGSFTRAGDEKECRECGGWGEGCDCWKDDDDSSPDD